MSNSEDRMVRTFGALVVGLIAGGGVVWLSFRDEIKFAEKFSLLKSCDELMTRNHVEMSDEAYGEPLINGYMSGLDRFSYYRSGAFGDLTEIAEFVNALPTALGSGFEVNFDESGMMYFEEVVPGMPADIYGICVGDVVQSIDGESVIAGDKRSAASIGGKDGTSCKLVLLRGSETVEVEFVRSNSEGEKRYEVNQEMRGDILCIRIPTITSLQELTMLETEEYSSVILDLRDNHGGNIDFAVSYAANFVADGYVKLHYYNGEDETTNVYGGRRIGVPVIVLVNEKTASAAEILTALLKQYGDVTIVGTNTFGKGIFQKNESLGDGVLCYTHGYITVGRWDCWNGVGIAPDVEVQMDRALIGTPEDIQLKKALEIAGNMH